MKISRFIFLTIIIIVIAIIWLDESNAPTTLYQEQWDNDQETIKLTIHPEDVYKGNLVLVNQEYGIKENNVKNDLINLFKNQNLLADYGVLDKNIQLSKEVIVHFNTMVEAAKEDGVTNFLISSGYRSFKQQEKLYQEKGKEFALPAGFSEHQLGISLDVGSSKGKMENEDEGKWIAENAWKYGFILRYPKDKTAITGIEYEPWHIRFVGKPHSKIMHDKDYVLEEYLAFLKDKKNVEAVVDGIKYDISYYPITKPKSVIVPANYEYEISGDNFNGVVVTIHK